MADLIGITLASGADDGDVFSGQFRPAQTWMFIGGNGAAGVPATSWVRFALDVPQGATITAATVRLFVSWTDGAGGSASTVYSEASDDPSNPTSIEDLSARPRGAVGVPSSFTGSAAGNSEWRFDATGAVNEAVNRPGWAPGNHVLLIFEPGPSTGNNQFKTRDRFDGHPLIDVSYEPAGGGPPSSLSVALDDPTPAGQTAGYEHVAGTVNVTWSAGGDVDRVDLYVDGEVAQADATSPYQWDTTGVANGVHTLRAVAVDTSDNEAFDEQTVTVNNEGVWAGPGQPVTVTAGPPPPPDPTTVTVTGYASPIQLPLEELVDGVTYSVTVEAEFSDASSLTSSPVEFAYAPGAVSPLGPSGSFFLDWEDTFDGPTFDSSKWVFAEHGRNAPGYGKHDAWHPLPPTSANLEIVDGKAVIKARADATAAANGKEMTTAVLSTATKKADFTHGVVEARLKHPTGKSLWPAFWLLGNGTGPTEGWPATGEVDILEWFNGMGGGSNSVRGVHFSVLHWGVVGGVHTQANYNNNYAQRDYFWDGEFHTYTCHRTSSFIRMYVDGDLIYEMKPGDTTPFNPSTPVPGGSPLFDDPMHVRIDLQVGGAGTWTEGGVSTWEEGDLLIDYVRIWTED